MLHVLAHAQCGFSGNLPQRAGPLDLGFIAHHGWNCRQDPTKGGCLRTCTKGKRKNLAQEMVRKVVGSEPGSGVSAYLTQVVVSLGLFWFSAVVRLLLGRNSAGEASVLLR